MSQGATEIFHGSAFLRRRRRWNRAAAGALAGSLWLALGCGSVPGDPLATVSEAVNVCDETVPDNRYVDGLPAYAQCDATTASIWSNNGIDTATSSQGNDWVRTQQGGGYQCTEWAYRYMHFRWGVDYRHGDAREWCDGMLPATLVKNTTPVHGDLIVFDGGVCGADATTGHIAVVDTVDAAKAKVTIVEENRAGRRSTDQSCATCFLHAVANDGSMSGAAGAAGNGAGAGAGNAGAAGGGGVAAAGGMSAGAGRGAGGAGAGSGAGGSGAGNAGAGGRGMGDGGSGGSAAGRGGGSGSAEMASEDSAGQGGSGASGVGGTPSAAGRGAGASDGAHSNDLALSETNEGGGCSVRSERRSSGAWVLFAALALGARARRRRSPARAW